MFFQFYQMLILQFWDYVLLYIYIWRLHGRSNLMFKVQQKRKKNLRNISKVSKKGTRMTSVKLFWCLYCYPWTHFTPFSIADFEL